MVTAGEAATRRLEAGLGEVEIEYEASHLAADVIFRTLFSIPITSEIAQEVFEAFRAYQRSQPLLSFGDLLRLPDWIPRYRLPSTRRNGRLIRQRLKQLTDARAALIEKGDAPNDLATKIMTMRDPDTGSSFSAEEMMDQVAIFFLAGHETSASALSWALYLIANNIEIQERIAAEALSLSEVPDFTEMRSLSFTRNVFRETLRLYPPVPMMVRENVRPECFRERKVAKGSLCILSPWHLQRHSKLWENPDVFDPDRWDREETMKVAREAYMPFSSGPRVCTGAGFAMLEGVILLALLVRNFRFRPMSPDPIPVAHLTVRSENGIWLNVEKRT
jgi:cytochrome P450